MKMIQVPQRRVGGGSVGVSVWRPALGGASRTPDAVVVDQVLDVELDLFQLKCRISRL